MLVVSLVLGSQGGNKTSRVTEMSEVREKYLREEEEGGKGETVDATPDPRHCFREGGVSSQVLDVADNP